MIGEPHDDEIQVEGLDEQIGGPRLRGTVIARRNAEDLYDALASDLIALSHSAVAAHAPVDRRRALRSVRKRTLQLQPHQRSDR
jgi:hypothetical protein